jgi:ParB-like chromosome segregation protein Spo0J|tara:strand:- start:1256 stop:1531 length:276 start_codon:yes stop_codon:yes gene_type:complete
MKDLIKQQNTEIRKQTGMIKEENLNEVDFGKIKLPSVVNRFLDKFVDSMKGANLNRMKRAAILYKVIDAAGMTPQQLMADIQKIKTAMKND